MDRQALMARLRLSLIEAMEEWLRRADEQRKDVGYVGDNTAPLMAEAALAVFAAVIDVQDYLIADGQLQA